MTYKGRFARWVSLAFILLYKHPRFFEKVALQTTPMSTRENTEKNPLGEDSPSMPFSGKLHFIKGPGEALPLPFSWAQELIGKKNKMVTWTCDLCNSQGNSHILSKSKCIQSTLYFRWYKLPEVPTSPKLNGTKQQVSSLGRFWICLPNPCSLDWTEKRKGSQELHQEYWRQPALSYAYTHKHTQRENVAGCLKCFNSPARQNWKGGQSGSFHYSGCILN